MAVPSQQVGSVPAASGQLATPLANTPHPFDEHHQSLEDISGLRHQLSDSSLTAISIRADHQPKFKLNETLNLHIGDPPLS